MAELIELQDDSTQQELPTDEVIQDPQDNLEEHQQTEEVIPEKYRGKSLDEIIKMHQEAEKLIGRQAQEVGETRKLADELIKQQLERGGKPTQDQTATQEIDFFDDPKKAVNQVVESNPILKQMQEQLIRQQQLEALARVEKSHPDFIAIDQNPEFKEWVSSSIVRKKLYEAASNFDADSAIELLDTYKALRNVSPQKAIATDDGIKQVNEQQRQQAIRAAGVQTGGTGESTKPTYRYADIMKLMMYDREKYNAMEPEIRLAYAEGRVKGRPS